MDVALLDLPRHLVLDSALLHVLIVAAVSVGPLVLTSGLGQLTGQNQLPLHSLALLGLRDLPLLAGQ